jgi:predicted transcriptional regulator
MYRCNLSFAQLCEYINRLVENDMLGVHKIAGSKAGKVEYLTTAKGRDYLELLDKTAAMWQNA